MCIYIHCDLGFVITGQPGSWDEGIAGPISSEAIQCEGIGEPVWPGGKALGW